MCLEWENKLKLYVKQVGLRKKRKFCLETFHKNLNKIKILEENTKEDRNVIIEEFFNMTYSDAEINIKHEIMEKKDSG